MQPSRRGRLAISAAALVAAVPAVTIPASARSLAGPFGPGCRPSSAVVAYHSDNTARPAVVSGSRPQACLVATGFGGAETQIAVTRDGTLVYEPAIITPGVGGTGYLDGAPGPHLDTQLSPGGLSLTGNRGARWTFDAPAGATWVPQDDSLYVDRTTGRIFYYALAADPVPDTGPLPLTNQLPAGYANLSTSGDDGRTWAETSIPGFVESENPRFTSAPPPAGGPRPYNYPDVAYWCGNNIVKVGLDLPSYRACYRSLDGGLTWQYASILASSPVPQHPQCGTNDENLNDGDPNYPEGAPDGSLYAEVQCGSRTFLARSRDEGATWPIVATLPADGELRVGRGGDLFLAYQSAAGPIVVQVSTNGGRSWSRPKQLTASQLAPITQWSIAERGAGALALSLLVQRGAAARYDGYLVYTPDATAADPLLWAAALNPASRPMRTAAPPAARDDFIGVDIAPDGSPWGSFAASCPGPVDPTSACAGQASNPEANEAVAGRLAFSA